MMKPYVKQCFDSLSEDLVLVPYPKPGNSKTNRTIVKVYPDRDKIVLCGAAPGMMPFTNTNIKGVIAHYDWAGKPVRPARTVDRAPKERVTSTLLWSELKHLETRLEIVEHAIAELPLPERTK